MTGPTSRVAGAVEQAIFAGRIVFQLLRVATFVQPGPMNARPARRYAFSPHHQGSDS